MIIRSLTSVFLVVLAVSAALAQEKEAVPPPPKPADDGPSLADTMKFIEDKLRAKAIAPFHGALTKAEANPANCQLTMLGGNSNEAIELVKFAEIEKIEVFQRVDEDNEPIRYKFDLMFHTKSQTAVNRYGNRNKVVMSRGQAELRFEEEDMANRVAKAMLHAVELCGGGSKPEPF
jgi:hypothetical protein